MEDKNLKKALRLRTAAAVLYALLCVYQMASLRFTLLSMQMGITVTSLTAPWIAEMLLGVLAGAMAVWLIAKRHPVGPAVQRGAVLFTVLVIAFELISYEAQIEALRVSLMVTLNSQDASAGVIYALLFARLALWIIGVFLLFCAGENAFSKNPDNSDLIEENAVEDLGEKPKEISDETAERKTETVNESDS